MDFPGNDMHEIRCLGFSFFLLTEWLWSFRKKWYFRLIIIMQFVFFFFFLFCIHKFVQLKKK